MSRPNFHRSAEECNPPKAEQLRKRIEDDVDYTQANEEQPLCLGVFSTYTILLLPMNIYPEEFQQHFKEKYIDPDMQDDLERASVINWLGNVRRLYPLKTTADGNCLLHTVSQAMWGIEDTKQFLRRLLYVTLTTDPRRHFQQRWLYTQRTSADLARFDVRLDTSDYSREWETVIQATEDIERTGDHGLPYTALESIHLYVLANILRRPIILLTDPRARNVFGQSLQECHIGGIYLPLEWNAGQCSKDPIVIGYSMNHFAPLIGREDARGGARQEAHQAVPLVMKDMSSLTVQYLLPNEEREVSQLLTDYLKVKEVYHRRGGDVLTVLCAEWVALPLPGDINMMDELRKSCEKRFRRWIDQETGLTLTPDQNHVQILPLPPHITIAPRQSAQSQPQPQMNIRPQQPQLNIRPQVARVAPEQPRVPAVRAAPGAVHAPVVEQTPEETERRPCITVGCDMTGSPDMANMCTKCFYDFTVQYQRQEEAAKRMQKRDKERQRTQEQVQQQLHQQPWQQQARRNDEYLDLSIMGEDCHAGCGFKCSTQTYPYCHECHPKMVARENGLDQPAAGTTPAVAVPPVLNSMMPDDCRVPGCQFRCSETTYPYCHEHVPAAGNQDARPTAPSASIVTGTTQFNLDRERRSAANPPEQHLLLRLEDMSVQETSAPGAAGNQAPLFPQQASITAPLVPLATTQGTGSLTRKCKQPGCNSDAIKGNNGLCEACYNVSMFGEGTGLQLTPSPNDDLSTEPFANSNQDRQIDLCQSPNCKNAVMKHQRTCSKCFIKTGRFPSQDEFAHAATGPTEAARAPAGLETPEVGRLSNNLNDPRSLTVTSGQPVYPTSSGRTPVVTTATVVSIAAPSAGTSATGPVRKYLCPTAGCEGIRSSTESGLCFSCLQGNGRLSPEPTHYAVPAAPPPAAGNLNESFPSPSCSPYSLNEQERKELNPLITSSKQKVKCAAAVCKNMIYPPRKLCDNCSVIIEKTHAEEQKKREQQRTSAPERTPRALTAPMAASGIKEPTKARHQTAPLNIKSQTRSSEHCREEGCERFGDPSQKMRCSEHFRLYVQKQNMLNLNEPNRQPEVTKQIPQFKFEIGAGSAVEHNLHGNSRLLTNPRRHGTVSPEMTPEDNQFRAVLTKVEKSMKSRNLCLNNSTTGCMNYANPQNQGFCNSCYKEAQYKDHLRREELAAQTQFG